MDVGVRIMWVVVIQYQLALQIFGNLSAMTFDKSACPQPGAISYSELDFIFLRKMNEEYI